MERRAQWGTQGFPKTPKRLKVGGLFAMGRGSNTTSSLTNHPTSGTHLLGPKWAYARAYYCPGTGKMRNSNANANAKVKLKLELENANANAKVRVRS